MCLVSLSRESLIKISVNVRFMRRPRFSCNVKSDKESDSLWRTKGHSHKNKLYNVPLVLDGMEKKRIIGREPGSFAVQRKTKGALCGSQKEN